MQLHTSRNEQEVHNPLEYRRRTQFILIRDTLQHVPTCTQIRSFIPLVEIITFSHPSFRISSLRLGS